MQFKMYIHKMNSRCILTTKSTLDYNIMLGNKGKTTPNRITDKRCLTNVSITAIAQQLLAADYVITLQPQS